MTSGKSGTRLLPVALTVLMASLPWAPAMAASLDPGSVSRGLDTASYQQMTSNPRWHGNQPAALAIDPGAPTLRGKQAIASKPKSVTKDPAMLLQQVADPTDPNDAGLANNPGMITPRNLAGNITSIHVTRGRSQIIKFAQPVMRISIAEPTMADVIPLAPDQLMINGKQRGVTSLIVWDENGQEGIFDLYVENDTSELMDAVRTVAPNEKIQARVTDDSFVLSGQVSSSVALDEIRKTAAAFGFRDDKFIDLTDTPVPQVQLDVRIAEANRSVGRILKTSFASQNGSLQLSRLGSTFDATRLTALGRATPGLIPANAIQNMAVNNIGGVTGTAHLGNNFQATWDFLETEGKVNTLANPTLVCTHGRTASFLAGGEFPFVGSVDQNGSPIIQYKEYGVKLNFTPWISMRSGRIEIKVAPEVSNLDASNCVTGAAGAQVCGILKRTTDTTVELNDGESLMISGILTREEQNTFAKVPFIGSVPILGNFFKNANMSKADRELVVVITPHIVKNSDYGKILGVAQP